MDLRRLVLPGVTVVGLVARNPTETYAATKVGDVLKTPKIQLLYIRVLQLQVVVVIVKNVVI